MIKYDKIYLARTEVLIINKKCHKTNYLIIDQCEYFKINIISSF
jgi:hypothetical protein